MTTHMTTIEAYEMRTGEWLLNYYGPADSGGQVLARVLIGIADSNARTRYELRVTVTPNQ